MPALVGNLVLSGLPPHLGMLVSLCFFAVKDRDSPAPYNGDPPTEAATDLEEIVNNMPLKNESRATSFEQNFQAERPAGYYFVQVRVVLFQKRGGKIFGQLETFFFSKRPICFDSTMEQQVTFPVMWPDIPLENLHTYGVFKPSKKRPWWRFW